MKSCGVLMHISSLPGSAGIGSMGKSAYDYVDFLAKSGLRFWQVLPLNTTSYGDSPYQSPSAFAGNPYFIDLETLQKEGLLEQTEKEENNNAIDYEKLFNERYIILKAAFKEFKKKPPAAFKTFCKQKAWWLDDYAVFMSVKESYGMKSWEHWDKKHRTRKFDFTEYEENARFYKFLQFKFFTQWSKLKKYANSKGVKIIGDMPIYVAYDSVDVWSNPKMFKLDRNLIPKEVAGVPPDLFSDSGQLWGNPIYDWKKMEQDNYGWWKKRIAEAMQNFDMVRIDHFRGFEKFYAVPYGMKDAKIGKWRKAAGKKLFDAIHAEMDANIIAEDLGLITVGVKKLVKHCGYPNMKVLQFAFDGNPKNEFLPVNYKSNCVAYTGTHDNDTTLGWFKSVDNWQKDIVKSTLNCKEEDVVQACIEYLLASKADTVIIPMQDFLNLDTDARMNIPSTPSGNWIWRLQDLDLTLIPKIKAMLKKYNRI